MRIAPLLCGRAERTSPWLAGAQRAATAKVETKTCAREESESSRDRAHLSSFARSALEPRGVYELGRLHPAQLEIANQLIEQSILDNILDAFGTRLLAPGLE